jgi:hypothetical protein
MINFKKNSILILCLCALGVSINAWALHSNDIPGYYILSSFQAGFNDWTDTTSGTCPGITFPSSIAPGMTPISADEILIDPKSISFPYTCSTIYATAATSGPAAGQCLVSIELIVKNGAVTKVNLSTIPLLGNCKAFPNNPNVILGPDQYKR